jgi:hypothetical protein
MALNSHVFVTLSDGPIASIHLEGVISFLDNALDAGLGARASYSSFTSYIVPGTGSGSIQATVYASSLGGSTEGGSNNEITNFTLGSTSYDCRFIICSPGPTVDFREYAVTGGFTLGQPFTVGFSISQYLSVILGEQATEDVQAGFVNVKFFDGAGNPVTPAEVVPEPLLSIPVGLAVMLLYVGKKKGRCRT